MNLDILVSLKSFEVAWDAVSSLKTGELFRPTK